MKLKTFIASLICVLLEVSNASSGSMLLTGIGPPPVVAGGGFQGPGDVVNGALIWGSCARVYNASLASTATSLCDLKDFTTGTVAICTLRGTSSGFVDLAGSYCVGSTTPAVACAAAAGGSCRVSKVYDQTVNVNHMTNATVGSMPLLTFGALGGLPGLTCVNANGTVLTSTSSITQAQPFTMSSVAIRGTILGNTTTTIGPDTTAVSMGYSITAANTGFMNAGATGIAPTISDAAFHALNGVFNAASSKYNVDGTDNTGPSIGTLGFSAGKARFCRTNTGFSSNNTIMEAGVWPSGFTLQNLIDMSANQHSLVSGYNF